MVEKKKEGQNMATTPTQIRIDEATKNRLWRRQRGAAGIRIQNVIAILRTFGGYRQ